MKHNFKRVLALFLAVVMCMTCTLPIFASNGESGTCPEAGNEAAHTKDNCTAIKIDTVAPACETTGYTVYQCDVCKVYFMDDIIKALEGCVWGETTTVLPTCTTDGSETKYCSTHDYTSVKVLPATGHDWSEWVADGAICTEGGTTETRTCLNGCGATETQPATPGEHAWGEPTFTIVPTCTTEGEATYTCSACGATKTVLVKPMTDGTVHDWDMANAETITVADCQTKGQIKVTCKKCGYSEIQETDYADCDYSVDAPAQAPTCQQEGWDAHKQCSVCGAHEPGFKTYAKLPHSYTVFVSRTKAKCGVEGHTIWKCATCDETWKEVHADQIGDHVWQITPLTPTCSTYGHDFYFCPRCGETKTENVMEPYDHHLPTCEDHDACLEANNGIPCNMKDTGKGQLPNCSSAGTTIYACDACGEEMTVSNTQGIGAGEHNFVEVVYEKANCVNGDGERRWQCTICGAYETDAEGNIKSEVITLPALDSDEYKNNPEYHIVVTEIATGATCTIAGLKITFCKNCDVYPKTETEYYSDHVVLEGTYVRVAPTCTVDGSETYVCAVCGQTITTILDKTGHTPADTWEIKVPANCIDNGVKVKKCTVCQAELETDLIPKNGHSFELDEVPALTCVYKRHEHTETCSVCTYQQPTGEVSKLTNRDLADSKYHVCLANGTAKENAAHHRPGSCDLIGLYSYICPNMDHTIPGETDAFYVEDTSTNKGHPTYNEDGTTKFLPSYITGAYIISDYVAPTCVSKGKTLAWKCPYCDATGGGEEIDYAAHNLLPVEVKNPTCTDYGWAEHFICQYPLCGDYFADAEGTELLENGFQDVYAPALGHDFKEVDIPATCTTNGAKKNVCQREGCTEEIVLVLYVATGHDYDDTIVPVDCETVGYVYHICKHTACVPEGEDDYGIKEYIDGYTRATGHAWTETKDCINGDSWTCANNSKHDYVEEARGGHANAAGQPLTCKTDASVTDRVCAECGQEILPGTHSFVTSHVDPTCLKYGYTLHVCVVCQYYYTIEDDIKTLGDHKPGDYVVTTPATCTTAGVETQYCTVCSEVLDTNEIEALGHDYTVVVDEKAAEVLVPGYQILGCANGCGSTITNTIDALDGIKFSYSYDNAVVSGANYVNTGKIALTIDFEAKNATLNSILLALEFDPNVLSVVEVDGYEFTCDRNVFVDCEVGFDNTLGKVSVKASVNADNDEVLKNETLANGKSGLVVIYFNVNATAGYTLDAAKAASLGFTVVEDGDQSSSVLDKDALATIGVNYGTIVAPKLSRLGDVNNDGQVTDADAVKLLDIYFAEGYSAEADINQDGEIGLADYQLLKQFVVANITYEKLCKGEVA